MPKQPSLFEPPELPPCPHCGGDARSPNHWLVCDGRQGKLEAIHNNEPEEETERTSRYSRALAIYRDTSRDAWESVLRALPAVDARIVGHIYRCGGATSEECEHALGLKHQTVSAQIRHMYEAGLLALTGEKRPTESGRAAYVWSLPQ